MHNSINKFIFIIRNSTLQTSYRCNYFPIIDIVSKPRQNYIKFSTKNKYINETDLIPPLLCYVLLSNLQPKSIEPIMFIINKYYRSNKYITSFTMKREK